MVGAIPVMSAVSCRLIEWRSRPSSCIVGCMGKLTLDELEAGLDDIRGSPADEGAVVLIVRRPTDGEREELDVAEVDLEVGLVGDNWLSRGSHSTPDGSANPDSQINIMNARVAALVAQAPERRALAGDQLYLDLELSVSNLPTGTWLVIGSAVLEVTAKPHKGCAKFTRRFGLDALRFVNSSTGKALRLRGLCAKVVQPGTIRRGDVVNVHRRAGASSSTSHPATPKNTSTPGWPTR